MLPLRRAVSILGLLVFVFSVVVQVNDPDPLRWMAIYGSAALACALALRGPQRIIPAIVGVASLVWAATIAPRVVGRVGLAELVQSWDMKGTAVEEGRELGGLLVVAVWMAVLAVGGGSGTGEPSNGPGA